MHRLLSVLVLISIFAAPYTQAHHSFAAEYDGNQPVAVTGILSKVLLLTMAKWRPGVFPEVRPAC